MYEGHPRPQVSILLLWAQEYVNEIFASRRHVILTIFSRTVLWNNCSLRSASSSIFTYLSAYSLDRPGATTTFYCLARFRGNISRGNVNVEGVTRSWLVTCLCLTSSCVYEAVGMAPRPSTVNVDRDWSTNQLSPRSLMYWSISLDEFRMNFREVSATLRRRCKNKISLSFVRKIYGKARIC